MSDTNERIAQISALTLNHEKLMNNNRNVSEYQTASIIEAIKSLADLISYTNVKELEFIMQEEAKEVNKGANNEHPSSGL